MGLCISLEFLRDGTQFYLSSLDWDVKKRSTGIITIGLFLYKYAVLSFVLVAVSRLAAAP